MRLVDDLRQDVRYGFRSFATSPGFTATAVATLAIGIGAAIAIFTVVNAVLLRPLPLREPDRLAVINAEDLKLRGTVGASWTKYELLREQNVVFSDLGAYLARELTVDTGQAPAQVPGARVTAGFFHVLGIALARGRTFSAGEDVAGAAPVAIVSDAFWRTRLGANPDVVGRTIRIEGRDAAIVGVLPSGFRFQFADREPQVYLTSVFTPGEITGPQIRTGAGFLTYVARLLPGTTIEQARADLAAFDERYRREHGSFVDAGKYELHLVRFLDDLVGNVRPALFMLMGAVLLLLLIACANVAHLLLARAAVRQHEVAIRLAIGASRTRLVRQLLTESLLLALGGAALGVFGARAAVSVLVAYGPANIPRLGEATPDARVTLFALVLACITAAAFGLVPALRAGNVAPGDTLKDGRAGGTTGRAGGRLHGLIAASETAVTVVLLIAAGLLFQSLVRLQAVEPGFDPRHVFATQIALPADKFAEPLQREAFFTTLLHEVHAQPGISAAGATSYLPMGGANYGFFFFVEGRPRLGAGRDPTIAVRHVSADYFRVMNIPIRRGRPFSESDAVQSQPVAIVSDSTARRYFADVDPIGRHLANSRDGLMREIVGVVGDVKFDGPARDGQDELYLPYRQVPWPSMAIVVSSALTADVIASGLRRAVARVDPDQAVAAIRPMPSVVAATTTQQQFTSSLLASFALVATALAAIGLYGVIALFVSQKRREFGIRMALGAQRAEVLRLVMRQGAKTIAAGTAAGLIGAAGFSRLLRGLLFGVSASQPSTYATAAVVLVAIGLAACYLPARRATSVPLVDVLRAE